MAETPTPTTPEELFEASEAIAKTLNSLPAEARKALASAVGDLASICGEHNLTPRQGVVAIAGLMASFGMAEVGQNPYDKVGLGDFLNFCGATVHFALATMRVDAGWTPNGQS